MQRHQLEPRPDWRRRVEELGFLWHTTDDQTYWSESAYYDFTSDEIAHIEQASEELARLFLAAGDYVVQERRFAEFGIPDWCIPLIVNAWEQEPPALNYGRFDLGMDGNGTIKLFEFNCDTPTSLIEASVVQWFWKQDVFPGLDQFNAIHEALVHQWAATAPRLSGKHVHFAHIADRLGEDTLTTAYMMDIAKEAGLDATQLVMRDIGWKDGAEGGFFDLDGRHIDTLYKLYPWEWLVNEPFGRNIAGDPGDTLWIEPIWKMIWSNKAILTVLWRLFPGHPNLLWAGHQPPPGNSYVRKPILGREGGNVVIICNGQLLAETGGPSNSPLIYQGFFDIPAHDGNYPVIGSWMVDGACVGMGVREGGRITANQDRFVPHVIDDYDF